MREKKNVKKTTTIRKKEQQKMFSVVSRFC